MATVPDQIATTAVPVRAEDSSIRLGDAEKLRALVRSVLTNVDRISLDTAIYKAYRLGNESCHRAMALDEEAERPKSLQEVERTAFQRTYTFYNGDVKKTASALGIGRTTAYRKLREYGIIAPSYQRCPNCGCNLRTYEARKS